LRPSPTRNTSTLELRVFKRISDGSLVFNYATELSVGGRLSRARLETHRRVIDAYLGAGATALLDLKTTVVFGTDLVGEFLELLPPRRTVVARRVRAPRSLAGLATLARNQSKRREHSAF
jgi:hypothetical protein